MQTADRWVPIAQPELLGIVFSQLGPWATASKRALAATCKTWHHVAWAATDAAGGHRLHPGSWHGIDSGPEGAAKLQSLLDFLLRRRPRVQAVWLTFGIHLSRGTAASREHVQGLACAVLALLSDQPFRLHLGSYLGAHWLPCLGRVAHLTLNLSGSSTEAACVDWLADRLPCLKHLGLHGEGGWLSARAQLPPLLRQLDTTGVLLGTHRAFPQLRRLSIDMLLCEDCVPGTFPSDIMQAIVQATRLTQLSLNCIYPEDAFSFFAHLGAATQLHSLTLSHGLTDAEPCTYDDEEAAVQLSKALGRLTRLTALDLSGMCTSGMPGGAASLPALQTLNLSFNHGVTDLPAGPFRRSLTELHADWGLVEAAMQAGPRHALWDHLQVLDIEDGWASAEAEAAFRATARERLPGLQI